MREAGKLGMTRLGSCLPTTQQRVAWGNARDPLQGQAGGRAKDRWPELFQVSFAGVQCLSFFGQAHAACR